MTSSLILPKVASTPRSDERMVEDNDYEFDITCPYCDSEFVIDLSDGTKNKVICPECNKTIELDWNEESNGCSHNCGGCSNCEDKEKNEDVDDDM